MTSIKPPDGRPSSIPPAGPGETGSPERAGGPSFREALERAGSAGQTEGTARAPAETAAAADPVGELARAVRSGALSAEQAIERLVERAVAAVGGQLSAAQRSELSAVLHEALQSDPALRELRDAVK
jgi:hypothetical protein